VLEGGYVGLEPAQTYRCFGSRVTVIESGPKIAGREDPDVAAAIMETLADEGITVQLGARVLEVEGRSGAGVKIRLRTAAGEGTIEGSDLLAAVGRTPNTSGIGLESRACLSCRCYAHGRYRRHAAS
jgi:pyruvate/2-oxoglutarate dehydrogenase complex dihydrolipoamide dehydrogenase (E3) component